MTKKILVLVLTVLLLPLMVFAEEVARGRLPDGRAYRTDSSGIQLVDHVAELELTIESLTRRLEAAENEVRHKDELLAQQLQPVSAPEQSADLGSLNAKTNCPPQPQFVCPDQSLPELNALKEKLTLSEKLNATLQQQKEKDGIWFEQTLAARDQEISSLKLQVKTSEEKKSQLAQVKGIGLSDNARAALQLASHREIKPPNTNSQAQALLPEEKDIATFKKKLQQELAKTRSLLAERDQLFSQFSSNGTSIKIKPSSAHSGNNRTVDQLQKDLEDEQSVRILGLLSREIADIGRQVADDIELVKRVGKL